MAQILTDPQARLELVRELIENVSRASEPMDIQMAFRRMWKLRPVDLYVSASVRGLQNGQYKITRQIETRDVMEAEDDGLALYAQQNPWSNWERIPVHEGGLVGELIEHGEPVLRKFDGITGDPVLGDVAREMRSMIATPIFDQGQPLNWAFQFARDPDALNEDSLELFVMMANLSGTATRNLVAVQEAKRATDRLRTQFEEVARVQQSLLPRKLPSIPGLALATSYLTSDQAGGDYYDFFPFEDGRWGILIADVAGHGAAAATVMAMLHAILHAYEGSGIHPHLVLEHANSRLVAAGLEGAFTTAFLAVFDPATGEFQFSRAGHNPPRLKKDATGELISLEEAGSLPLGVFEPLGATSASIRLDPGDTVVLYTDGITEAFNTGREMFGVDGLDASLDNCSGAPDCVVDSVHGALYEHTKSRTRDDDQTIVAIRYNPTPKIDMPTIETIAGVMA
ncbi:MAG: serine/threonine-protein phosphatase [Phycisphaerales bacterium]|nr:serine/threonine-protein phosphatase [Phycisphaerales bacterium]